MVADFHSSISREPKMKAGATRRRFRGADAQQSSCARVDHALAEPQTLPDGACQLARKEERRKKRGERGGRVRLAVHLSPGLEPWMLLLLRLQLHAGEDAERWGKKPTEGNKR